MDAQKSKKRPRVTKYIESGKAYFPRVCKDIQELAYQSKKFPTMKTIGADASKKAAPAEKNGAQATFTASAKDAEPAKVEIDFSNVEVEPLFCLLYTSPSPRDA